MANTLVGYFDDYAEARQTEQELINSGFRIEDVQIVAREGTSTAETVSTETPSVWERLKSAFGFVSDQERVTYEEAARHGGALLTVRVPEEQTNEVADLIERHHPVDIDRRIEEWRGSAESTQVPSTTVAAEQSIPIAQEELKVGKRAVQRGAVRIHTYVTEQPVEEQVTLRQEQAYVERQPVAPTIAGEEAFQERTIEVQEMGEEAVVAKQARVVEEVAVGKEETEVTETIRDTVRKTEVEVEHEEPTPKK